MKKKVNENPKKDNTDTPVLSDMYCAQEIEKILQSRTVEELNKLGLKEDVWVSYTRILGYLLLCGIGAYSAMFTGVEKNRLHLQICLVAFFAILALTLIYDKAVIHGATYRLQFPGKFKVLIWCNFNWRHGTYDITYARVDNYKQKETYQIPLGEVFFDDGRLDEDWYHQSMDKLCQEIKKVGTKKTK
ncbi:uncharacterized protein BXIN_0681 [Babesia sp. Xinjiang]|uniref:uncharacterized protein n=1 Tax=Babesia sp. Xinjiang TaxID=462227 RepID=UPI000A26395E|nr:uncharacterized protein BXIN_0718 [Babesia sp. Xinjiang]XP_028872602.1 uncharacterized protein BXIN_0681 [Babesia sp. Xinjiang]ORM42105.1 hypothetical protein BXIN_0718 [Babesia sp. Xinjiang]ORM42146.1 hypothetical protein BXIN_0681 [Babesia sp. Xinjiang]